MLATELTNSKELAKSSEAKLLSLSNQIQSYKENLQDNFKTLVEEKKVIEMKYLTAQQEKKELTEKVEGLERLYKKLKEENKGEVTAYQEREKSVQERVRQILTLANQSTEENKILTSEILDLKRANEELTKSLHDSFHQKEGCIRVRLQFTPQRITSNFV